MKYFFLSDGWVIGRVWEVGGLWDEGAWRRKPQIQQMNLCIVEHGERLWLYQVEEIVLMVEVRPGSTDVVNSKASSIGQVVLKRLMTSEQVLDMLCHSEVLTKGSGTI